MKRVKISSLLYRIIIGGFGLFSSYFFIWSEFGLIRHYEVKQSFDAKEKSLLLLKKEIDTIEQEVDNWKIDKFYLEKMAREELGMGYKDEVVYLVNGVKKKAAHPGR